MQNRIKAINRIEEQEGFSDWLGGYTELDLLMYLWEPHDVAVVLGKLLLDKLGVETLREIDRANSETVYGRCASYAGEDLANQTLARLREKFGQAIAAVINILDPDAIVVGGGVGNLPIFYEESTRETIRRHLFNSELKTKILRPLLGDSAGVFGAALLSAQRA